MAPLARHRRHRIAGGALAGLALSVLVPGLAACGSDATHPSASSAPAGSSGTGGADAGAARAALPPYDDRELPPTTVAELSAIYGPVLDALGVHLTRGALIDTTSGGYTPSDTGTHLALYVAPNDPFSTDQYAAGIAPLAAAVTSDVFARWPGLHSYDICQEGVDIDGDPETLPETMSQMNIERAALTMADWDHISLVDILALVPTTRSVTLSAKIDLRRTPTFTAAQQEAAGRAGAAGPTTAAPAGTTSPTQPADATP